MCVLFFFLKFKVFLESWTRIKQFGYWANSSWKMSKVCDSDMDFSDDDDMDDPMDYYGKFLLALYFFVCSLVEEVGMGRPLKHKI